ncbi:MAG: dienelactone hydrolase family protein [Thermoanaerobaculia bacterium]
MIRADGLRLEGEIVAPPRAAGLVLFAHGSGSSRHSPRNQAVAARIRQAGLGTLLFDLLSREEETVDAMTGHLRFDVGLLARRLVAATAWVRESADMASLRVGYFGASTGAAAALIAAAEVPGAVGAVVSRGGRPDLAGEALSRVKAPTLLIVGGRDEGVIELNEEAYERLRCEKSLQVVPGATHLFGEPGALEAVAALAAGWFERHLSKEKAGSPDALP